MENNNMQNWIFTKNTYKEGGEWMCTTRDHQMDLFNNPKSKFVIRSSSIETLEYIINKGEGDLDQVIQYLNNTFKANNN